VKRESPNESFVLDKALKKSGRNISNINAEAAKEILCMIFNFHFKLHVLYLAFSGIWRPSFSYPNTYTI